MYEGGIKNNAEGGEPGERGGREPLASSLEDFRRSFK